MYLFIIESKRALHAGRSRHDEAVAYFKITPSCLYTSSIAVDVFVAGSRALLARSLSLSSHACGKVVTIEAQPMDPFRLFSVLVCVHLLHLLTLPVNHHTSHKQPTIKQSTEGGRYSLIVSTCHFSRAGAPVAVADGAVVDGIVISVI